MSYLSESEGPILRATSDVEEVVAAFAWPHQDRPDPFGIEVEAFPLVIDNSFRNWDYRIRRQIFSGIRLAWDVA